MNNTLNNHAPYTPMFGNQIVEGTTGTPMFSNLIAKVSVDSRTLANPSIKGNIYNPTYGNQMKIE